jgi:hypothetical protein
MRLEGCERNTEGRVAGGELEESVEENLEGMPKTPLVDDIMCWILAQQLTSRYKSLQNLEFIS